jgi:hypothetical protein
MAEAAKLMESRGIGVIGVCEGGAGGAARGSGVAEGVIFRLFGVHCALLILM